MRKPVLPHCVNGSKIADPAPMPRLIKRYGSRKLYDTAESRYVGLEDVAQFVRSGEDVRVVDNRSGDDATAAVLTQIISEEGRSGGTLSPGFLHDLLRVGERTIRRGEEAVEAGLKTVRQGADDLARRGFDLVRTPGPISDVRDEMTRLRERLERLEQTLDHLDAEPAVPHAGDGQPAQPGA